MRRLEITSPQAIQLRVKAVKANHSLSLRPNLVVACSTYYGRFSGNAYSLPLAQACCTPRSLQRRSNGSRYSDGNACPSWISGALSTRAMNFCRIAIVRQYRLREEKSSTYPVRRLDAYLPFVHRVDDQFHAVNNVVKDELSVI